MIRRRDPRNHGRSALAVSGMPRPGVRSIVIVAEFAVVTVWPVAARQQRRVAALAAQVPVPHHPDAGNAHCPRQMRTAPQ